MNSWTDGNRSRDAVDSAGSEAATTQVRTITVNDEDAVAPFLELQFAYPDAAIYLSGSLTVDFPEEVKLPILPDQDQTVS